MEIVPASKVGASTYYLANFFEKTAQKLQKLDPEWGHTSNKSAGKSW